MSKGRDLHALASRIYLTMLHSLRRMRREDDGLGLTASQFATLSTLVNRGAMTLTELLVVMAILGILLLLALPVLKPLFSRTHAIEAKTQLKHLAELQKIYLSPNHTGLGWSPLHSPLG